MAFFQITYDFNSLSNGNIIWDCNCQKLTQLYFKVSPFEISIIHASNYELRWSTSHNFSKVVNTGITWANFQPQAKKTKNIYPEKNFYIFSKKLFSYILGWLLIKP